MRLYHTATSPFVRKVMVVALETGTTLETTFLRPTPLSTDETLSKENPLSKIPVLVTPDGPLYDSPVICEYLDGLHAGPKLIPTEGPARFRVLRQQALCDGILDAGIVVFYEHLHRPKELVWQPWLDGHKQKVLQGLDALEHEVTHFGDEVDLAQICVGVTLGWLEFRDAVGDVRTGRPRLFRWYERFRARPSMRATEPRA
jgi:glutathione S-transferase